MKQPKVYIGVSGPDKGGFVAWVMTAWAIRRCGAVPVRITPLKPLKPDELHGLVIGGGSDVHPTHYGELMAKGGDKDPRLSLGSWLDWIIASGVFISRFLFAETSGQNYAPERDQLEKRLIEYALYNELPILGICRGAQLMNVICGGSLNQTLGGFYSEDSGNIKSVLPRKVVNISKHSQLRSILGTYSCRVNALHTQSIKDLGQDIRISAVEPNGIVQAIERSNRDFFVGVQWHPEYIPQQARQQALFRALVKHANAGIGTPRDYQ